MEIKILESHSDIAKVESLRAEVLHMDATGTYYLNELLSGKEYAAVTLDEDEIVAGCYFHRFENILMIDQLFVKEEYQNKGYNLGRKLIEKLIMSKERLEYILGGDLDICKIESNNEKDMISI